MVKNQENRNIPEFGLIFLSLERNTALIKNLKYDFLFKIDNRLSDFRGRIQDLKVG